MILIVKAIPSSEESTEQQANRPDFVSFFPVSMDSWHNFLFYANPDKKRNSWK